MVQQTTGVARSFSQISCCCCRSGVGERVVLLFYVCKPDITRNKDVAAMTNLALHMCNAHTKSAHSFFPLLLEFSLECASSFRWLVSLVIFAILHERISITQRKKYVLLGWYTLFLCVLPFSVEATFDFVCSFSQHDGRPHGIRCCICGGARTSPPPRASTSRDFGP